MLLSIMGIVRQNVVVYLVFVNRVNARSVTKRGGSIVMRRRRSVVGTERIALYVEHVPRSLITDGICERGTDHKRR